MAEEFRWILILLGVAILLYVIWDARKHKNDLDNNFSDEFDVDDNDALLKKQTFQINDDELSNRRIRVEPSLEDENNDFIEEENNADNRIAGQTDCDVNKKNQSEKSDNIRSAVVQTPKCDDVLQSNYLTESEQLASNGSNDAPVNAKTTAPNAEAGSVEVEPELVISINLMADLNQEFPGKQLLKLFHSNGYKVDERGLFERFKQKEHWFSVANAFNPGFFDINQMDNFSTLGITFFMVLPGPLQPLEAFKQMLADIQALAEELGGQLQDSTHSVLTQQSIQYYREQIQNFQRKNMTLER